jgi:hypothetical protein
MATRLTERLAADLMRGAEKFDPVKLERQRGFIAGMRFVLNSPDLSERRLKHALRQIDTAEGDEG